ncbi:transporter substrate-binding domain-containing protein [Noviherbaspirillum sp.]|uniref:transporter substrate-binding domain-containing protein n=1 Tax=Noviherbaspirillum sp. TaxID=1926288 RepID=UPI002D5AC0FD|nr:transporter substrate-binding domain-containing protein [Noviherbaspirillum sp.]HZW20676.1 transporter substrate-binding domain-containing protein [Noviherbaspirillum sp.]
MNISLRLSRLLLAVAIAGIGSDALASGLDRARQRGKLQAGIQYVVPEYKGGMKFRTPETLDNALLEDVAKRLSLPLAAVPASSGKADFVLATVTDKDPLHRTHTIIPTGYSAGPMAIMRSDTDIKRWEQLKGRKVCVSEGGVHAGSIAAKYGAIEMVVKAPADALIAVRVGECDATVHDSAMLEELITYPEWKKFSARLPTGPRTSLAFVVPASDAKTAAFLRQVAAEWKAGGHPDKLMKTAVRNIAFEVYLDQNVPDCH